MWRAKSAVLIDPYQVDLNRAIRTREEKMLDNTMETPRMLIHIAGYKSGITVGVNGTPNPGFDGSDGKEVFQVTDFFGTYTVEVFSASVMNHQPQGGVNFRANTAVCVYNPQLIQFLGTLGQGTAPDITLFHLGGAPSNTDTKKLSIKLAVQFQQPELTQVNFVSSGNLLGFAFVARKIFTISYAYDTELGNKQGAQSTFLWDTTTAIGEKK
jgi:hypothetical protein